MNLVENVDHYTSSCGYCSSGDSAAMGMWAHKLSCEAYQDLLDRGWRRSGQWVYRPLPDNEAACRCHPYTIRLDANKFQPSKDQRKVLRRFEAFLEGRRCKPRGLSLQRKTCEGGAPLSYAQPDLSALHPVESLSEQQYLADDRKRKSHLISPSPVASPAGPHSLAEESSETLASPELADMVNAEFSSRAQSPAREAACPGRATSAATGRIGVPISREAVALPCSACEGQHARGRCPEQASGCCSPVGSEESAHSAVAARLIDQVWPEHMVDPTDHAFDMPDRPLQLTNHSQTMAGMVESALQQAVQQLVLAGQLPSMLCPALLVRAPTRKQHKMSCGNIVLTSPAAHALAAAARSEQGGSSVSAAGVAEALARQVAAGAAMLQDAAGRRLAARAEAGHVNFLWQSSCATEAPNTPTRAVYGLTADQLPPLSSAEYAQMHYVSGKAHMSSAPMRSPAPDSAQHPSSQQLWSISARHTGHGACRASNADNSTQADAGTYMQANGSFERAHAKQPFLPVDMDSSVERPSRQGLQSHRLGGTRGRGQRRSQAMREGTQSGPRPQELCVPCCLNAFAHAQCQTHAYCTGCCQAHPQVDPIRRTLDIRTLPASSDLVPVEFPLYRKYQILHHGEDPAEVTEPTFRRFLVDSPLVPSCSAEGVRFGSFHQQYWVDGELVAVGVVDVLPRCLSSAYLFWDPDWASLGLGKLTALKEIAWVQAASARCPSLQWYHMGYFLETCPKMRYKADFHPSELLCMRTYAWVALCDALPALKADSHCAIGMLDRQDEVASTRGSEGSVSGGDALVYCKQPDGQRQLLRLRELPDMVDGVAQELTMLLRAKLRVWQQLGGPTMTTFIIIV